MKLLKKLQRLKGRKGSSAASAFAAWDVARKDLSARSGRTNRADHFFIAYPARAGNWGAKATHLSARTWSSWPGLPAVSARLRLRTQALSNKSYAKSAQDLSARFFRAFIHCLSCEMQQSSGNAQIKAKTRTYHICSLLLASHWLS